MDPADASIIVNLREALSWVKRLDVEGKSVLVVRDSPVGLGFIQPAQVRGANCIILVGHHSARLHLGREVGADHTVNSREADFLSAVRDLPGGQGVDVFVDCVGDQKLLAEALQVVSVQGRVAVYAVPKAPPTGPKPEDPRIVHISTDEPGAHGEVVKLIAEGSIEPKHYYSDRLHYTDI